MYHSISFAAEVIASMNTPYIDDSYLLYSVSRCLHLTFLHRGNVQKNIVPDGVFLTVQTFSYLHLCSEHKFR